MKQILIVDDLPAARSLLQDAVLAAFPDSNCELAESLGAGLQAIQQTNYDLALVDLVLGDEHGTELIRELSAQQPQCTVVVASVMGDDENLFHALQAGAQGYLLKDHTQQELAFQLAGIAKGHLPLSPAIARKLMKFFQPKTIAQKGIEQSGLSQRELEVLSCLAKGIRMADIATQLKISHHTVGDHVKNIYRKLNINSRAEAAIKAQGFGLL